MRPPLWESVIYGSIMYSSNLLFRSCSDGSDFDQNTMEKRATLRYAVNILYMYYKAFLLQA